MRQYSLLEKPWGRALYCLFLFAILMLARDTLVTSSLLGFTKSQFLMLGLICVLGLVFLAVNRKQWKQILLDKRLLLMGGFAIVLLLPMVVKQDWQLMYFSILLCLLTAVFLTYFADVQQTAKYYVIIMALLCLHSIFSLWGLKRLVNRGYMEAPIFYNSAGEEFYNFIFSFTVTSTIWIRNFGIFREPGVYQFFIILAMYLNNYQVSWKKVAPQWIINGILAFTMLSTFAIGGLIETVLFALFLYADKKWYKTRLGRGLGLLTLVAFGSFVAYVLVQTNKIGAEGTLWFEFIDLYNRLFTKSNSLMDRLDAIFTSARHFFASPLVGKTLEQVLHGTNHNTSSTLILFAALGIMGGVLHVASWAALTWERERGLFGNLVILVILFMSFNTQNLVADVFFWLFPCMALTQRLLPKIELPGKKV